MARYVIDGRWVVYAFDATAALEKLEARRGGPLMPPFIGPFGWPVQQRLEDATAATGPMPSVTR